MSFYKRLTKSADGGKKDGDATGAGDDVPKKLRQRVLIVPSRGITFSHRHLMNDLAAMMPHSRKEVKFDTKSKLYELNELAELYNCNNVLFFEARKGQDLYMWASKIPNGPTVKFHVQNLHTMDELQFAGNCMKGSRPVLSFDGAFDTEPELRLIKEMFTHIFGVPKGARGSKPFIDHVMGFSIIDGKVWIRNYQVLEVEVGKKKDDEDEATAAASAVASDAKDTDVELLEIGPRFTLTPIIIQEGAFGGPIIYENPQFVSPNQVRSELRRNRADQRNERTEQQSSLIAKRDSLGLRTNSDVPKAARGNFDAKALFA